MAAAGLSQAEAKLVSQQIYEQLASRDPMQIKKASDTVDAFTRLKMREDGFYRKIIPPVPVTNEDLTRNLVTDAPIIIVDKEPNSPAAISVSFNTMPDNLYIRGNRYQVTFNRIMTPRFTKDVDQLRTWIMDIRQILSDNAIKDMLAEEDGRWIRACNQAVGTAGSIVPTSGTVQYQQLYSGVTRDAIADSLKVMPSTPSNLEVHTVLINQITVKDFLKFDRVEMGGDISQDIIQKGWTLQEFFGKQHIITIKKGLVPTNTVYHYGDPSFIGKNFILEDTTMWIRREAFMIEFFAYETLGGAIGNTSGIARVDFV
jgi:hypothetical protein